MRPMDLPTISLGNTVERCQVPFRVVCRKHPSVNLLLDLQDYKLVGQDKRDDSSHAGLGTFEGRL